MRDSLIGGFELRAGSQNPGHIKDRRLDDFVERNNRECGGSTERSFGYDRVKSESDERHQFGEDKGDRIEVAGENQRDFANENELRFSAFVDLCVKKSEKNGTSSRNGSSQQ